MAKRKRLTPLESPAAGTDDRTAPETRAAFPVYPDGVWRQAPAAIPPAPRAPIAGIAGEAAAVAALDELGRDIDTARADGRYLLRLPLAEVDPAYLVRDRLGLDPEEMEALVESLRRRGQQTAIEVADLGAGRPGGRWGLISGWRRLTALGRIAAEDGAADATILAAVRRPADAAAAYQAMVEENEVRAGLSHYERARIVARATDQGAYPDDRTALGELFRAASRPRRSKIGSFLRIVRALDAELRFPSAIGERLGLALSRALEEDAGAGPRLAARLAAMPPDSPEAETALLEAALRPDPAPRAPAPPPAPVPPEAVPAVDWSQSRGTLVLSGAPVFEPHFRRALRDWLAAAPWREDN